MFEDSWGLYEAPYPKKWMFHPPKRSVARPLFGLFTIAAAAMVLFEAFSHF